MIWLTEHNKPQTMKNWKNRWKFVFYFVFSRFFFWCANFYTSDRPFFEVIFQVFFCLFVFVFQSPAFLCFFFCKVFVSLNHAVIMKTAIMLNLRQVWNLRELKVEAEIISHRFLKNNVFASNFSEIYLSLSINYLKSNLNTSHWDLGTQKPMSLFFHDLFWHFWDI